MKWFAGILAVCALATEGLGLKCFSCMDSEGDCTQERTVCDSLTNQSCTTTLVAQVIGGQKSSMLVRSCGVCGEPSSFNTGYVRQSIQSHCCSSQLCNDRRQHVAVDTTPNGLECFGCFNHSSESCSESTSVLRCVSNENRCFLDHSTEIKAGSMIVTKGCASESICRVVKASTYGVQTTSDSFCCSGQLCNHASTPPGLKCHSQLELTEPVAIHCTSGPCKTLRVTMVTGAKSQELVISGCGTCEGGFSFCSGPFSVHVMEHCCQSTLCNNGRVTEAANTTLNGLECYGCTGSTSDSCEEATEIVKCAGDQHWCLYSSGTTAAGQTLRLLGCASPRVCRNPEHLRQFAFQPGPDFHCCQGNRCNHQPEGPIGARTMERPKEAKNMEKDAVERPIEAQTVGTGTSARPIAAQTERRDQTDPPIRVQMAGRGTTPPGLGVSAVSGNGLTVTGGSCGLRAALGLLSLPLLALGHRLL